MNILIKLWRNKVKKVKRTISKRIIFEAKLRMKMERILNKICYTYHSIIPEKVYYKYDSIQELVKHTDIRDVMKYLSIIHGEEFTNDLEDAYINVYNYIRNCEIIPQNEYILDPSRRLYYILVRIGNVSGIGIPYKYKDYDEINDIETVREVPEDYFPLQPQGHEHFAIEMSDWRYIAGLPYRVENKLKNNKGRTVAEILWEITFLGYTQEDVMCKNDIMHDRLAQAMEMLNDTPEI